MDLYFFRLCWPFNSNHLEKGQFAKYILQNEKYNALLPRKNLYCDSRK